MKISKNELYIGLGLLAWWYFTRPAQAAAAALPVTAGAASDLTAAGTNMVPVERPIYVVAQPLQDPAAFATGKTLNSGIVEQTAGLKGTRMARQRSARRSR